LSRGKANHKARNFLVRLTLPYSCRNRWRRLSRARRLVHAHDPASGALRMFR
jgi:hypothetical protein